MAEVVPTGSVHELTSWEYFVAVLLPRGFRYFEEAMNPVVKTKMKEAFPDKPEHIQARVEFQKTFEERLKHYREVVQPKAAEARDAEEIMGSVKRGDTNERFEACMLAIKARNPTLTDKKAEKLAKKEILKPVDDFHKLRKEHHFKSPDVKESRPKLECFMDDLNDHGDLYSIVLNKTYAWIDEQHIEGLHEAVAWERDQIRGWYDKNEKALPPWIQAVHSGLSGRMKPHSHDDGNSFDTFVLSVIIRNHMESVFEQWLLNEDGSAFVAQNLLSELAQAEKLRNHVAHDLGEPVFVLDIMNVLRCMHRITDALCGPAVAEGLQRVLEDGQELLKQQGHPVKTQISANEFEVGVFDLALRKFEVCLTQGVDDGWMYKDGNIVLPGVQEWDSTLRKRVKLWGKKLKSIATARHWLRHNTSKTPDLQMIIRLLSEAADALVALRETHEQQTKRSERMSDLLDRLKADATTAAEWNDTVQQVEIRITWSASMQPMALMVPHDRKFFGRTDELEKVSQALVETGARVLVHGPPGVGKDSLAKALFHSNYSTFVNNMNAKYTSSSANEVFYQGWIQGSTPALLEQQLISYFQRVVLDFSKAPIEGTVEHDEEVLKSIKDWLNTHVCWLFYIEDVTKESYKLVQELFPESRGHVLMTSKSALENGAAAWEPQRIPMEPFEASDSVRMWQHMVGSAQEEKETLETFLTTDIGGLPLSLRLCAVLYNKMKKPPITKFVSEFNSMKLLTVDRDGKSKKDSSAHYLGLVRSIMLVVKRIKDCHEDAVVLEALSGISILPASGAPLKVLNQWLSVDQLEEAMGVLAEYGLVQLSSEGRSCTMHQMVARCIREHIESQVMSNAATGRRVLNRVFLSIVSSVRPLLKLNRATTRFGRECVFILEYSANLYQTVTELDTKDAFDWLEDSSKGFVYGVLLRALAAVNDANGVLAWVRQTEPWANAIYPRVFAEVHKVFRDEGTQKHYGVQKEEIQRWEQRCGSDLVSATSVYEWN
jgi:hypothetical protein